MTSKTPQYLTADPDSLASLDKNHVWHPFTPMRRWTAQEPLIVESAEGVWLRDTKGNRYLDGVSSLWVNVHGHRHPLIDEAVASQLQRIAHSTLLGLGNVPSVLLAARLAEISPGDLNKVFYSDNGSTAVEVALKLAYQYWQIHGRTDKKEFVALANAYHGDTLGSVSVGGIPLFHEIFRPLLFPVHRVPTPYWYRCEQAPEPEACRDFCLDALRNLLEEKGDKIAAMVIEPLVQGAAGMLVQPEGYLSSVAQLCREHDVLLICDEVATGFGRTGTMFASEQEAVEPDLMAVAKGLTGGYLPVAATLATNRIFEAFTSDDPKLATFFHGHTYTGNPLGCAAALATLEIFERENTLERLQPKIQALSTLLADRIAPLEHCGEIRQRGFMVGIELVEEKATKKPYDPSLLVGYRVCQNVRRHGVILRPLGDVIVLMPPLAISEEELELLVDATRKSILEITENRSA